MYSVILVLVHSLPSWSTAHRAVTLVTLDDGWQQMTLCGTQHIAAQIGFFLVRVVSVLSFPPCAWLLAGPGGAADGSRSPGAVSARRGSADAALSLS